MGWDFLYKARRLAELQIEGMDYNEMKEAATSGRAFEIAEELTEKDIDMELGFYEKKEA